MIICLIYAMNYFILMELDFVVSSPLTLQHSMKISDLCQDIVSAEKRVHAVVAINKFGRVIEMNLQSNRKLSSLIDLTQKEQEILCMQSILQKTLLGEFDTQFGISRYMLVEREKLVEFVFPFCKGVILVLCKSRANTKLLSGKLSKMINDFALESEAESLK